ncbi:hypothetical protein [Caballeronia sp. SBC2]|uniref:hypothetical protein n=1 Tax=Caballeronia sp. SBC2 TaxID=2705547 RepID=UPI0013E9B88F|nr:hypothetical protein [Caballeronia sp. SBC2]
MKQINPTKGRIFRDLSAAETSALAVLNAQLVDAERWIRKGPEHALRAYCEAGGVNNHRFNELLSDDVEALAKVDCRPSRRSPRLHSRRRQHCGDARWFDAALLR